jgi:single-stranded-DNA-specific exonuclease
MEALPQVIQGVRHRWQLRTADRDLAREIAAALGLHPRVAEVLTARQITSSSQARSYLWPKLQDLPSPDQLLDLDTAVDRIAKALQDHESIAVYGDYDVDGLTATAVLVHFLSGLGGRVQWYLPHRLREGYGLNCSALHALSEGGVSLLISVDCGSSDHEAILLARELGLDLIVTDHHQPPDLLPPATALVNPKRQLDIGELKNLAGVGVAFYLVAALRAYLRLSGQWTTSGQPNLKDYLDWVALGTLADMAPLSAANRILTGTGLKVLAQTTKPGLQALKKISGLKANQVTAWDVLFRLGPRLNAAGRLGSADLALRLLLCPDPEEALDLALQLDELNRQRQSMESDLLAEVFSLVESDESLLQGRSLVLASPDWHKGLLGLAASRLVERYNKPAILLTRVVSYWEGSGRSFAPFDLYGILCRCRAHLLGFGGHQLAAGLRLRLDDLAKLRAAFEDILKESPIETGLPQPKKVDAILPLEQLTPEFMGCLELMAPYGEGNPEPVFCCYDFQVESLEVLKGYHLKLLLRQGNTRLRAIGFHLLNPDQETPHPGGLFFTARWDHWQGEKRLQLHILDYY